MPKFILHRGLFFNDGVYAKISFKDYAINYVHEQNIVAFWIRIELDVNSNTFDGYSILSVKDDENADEFWDLIL